MPSHPDRVRRNYVDSRNVLVFDPKRSNAVIDREIADRDLDSERSDQMDALASELTIDLDIERHKDDEAS